VQGTYGGYGRGQWYGKMCSAREVGVNTAGYHGHVMGASTSTLWTKSLLKVTANFPTSCHHADGDTDPEMVKSVDLIMCGRRRGNNEERVQTFRNCGRASSPRLRRRARSFAVHSIKNTTTLS
jgi:hypothetical protein